MRRGAWLYWALSLALGAGCGADDGSGGNGASSASSAIQTTSALFGIVGSPYASTLDVTEGEAPFTWTILGGSLPAGLTLNAGTGQIASTPAGPAINSNLTLQVKDATGRTATGSVLLAVHPRTDRVSINNAGAAGNGLSSAPSLSADGRFTAFVSDSTNLLSPTRPLASRRQVSVHDRQTNVTELVSRDNSTLAVSAGNGLSSTPAISGDGRFVAYVSETTNLLASAVPSVSAGQVHVRDRQTSQTSVVSVETAVLPNVGNSVSRSTAVSGDGSGVAFVSSATN